MIDIKMSGIISKYRNTSGMTLLEIMLSITIIGICIPFIFGILFTTNTIKSRIAAYNDIKNIKNDIISFIKLTSFETIYDVLNDETVILIDEQHDPELSFHNFTISKFHDIKESHPRYLCRLFPFNEHGKKSDLSDMNTLCALQMWCKIYKINGCLSNDIQKTLSEKSKADILFPVVKLR